MTTSNRNGDGLRRFNGAAPALIKHVVATLGVVIAAAFGVGVWLATVEGGLQANEKKTSENRESIDAIEKSLNSLNVDQKVLIRRFDDAEKISEKFQDRTGNALERILELLPRRERPLR